MEVILNCLAKDVNNAKAIYDILEDKVLIGVLSSDYKTTQSAIDAIKAYKEVTNNHVSLGLGGGNPRQGFCVKEIAHEVEVPHINQVYPLAGATLEYSLNKNAIVNAMIHPYNDTHVVISTGPLSTSLTPVYADIHTAVAMIKESGVPAIKFFPMAGETYMLAFRQLLKSCVHYDMILEPTGGITLDNYERILKACYDAGIKKVIIHIYSSIMDETGMTKLEAIKAIKKTMDRYNSDLK